MTRSSTCTPSSSSSSSNTPPRSKDIPVSVVSKAANSDMQTTPQQQINDSLKHLAASRILSSSPGCKPAELVEKRLSIVSGEEDPSTKDIVIVDEDTSSSIYQSIDAILDTGEVNFFDTADFSTAGTGTTDKDTSGTTSDNPEPMHTQQQHDHAADDAAPEYVSGSTDLFEGDLCDDELNGT